MSLYLKRLTPGDTGIFYRMLQKIGACENEFKNTAYGLSETQFQDWLIQQDNWSKGIELPDGYVPQIIFWLMKEEIPVGIGKIRMGLNEHSRNCGGNIGYAIDPEFRGHGYATQLLHLLVNRAKEIELDEILLTVEKYNPASKKVIEKCGGKLIKESADRWYFTFD